MPNIFSQPRSATGQSLQRAAKSIERAFPLKRRHLAELPYAVRDLSRLLTTERSQKQAYWSSPKFMGAYLRYFLPWNLLRLSRLLPALPLDVPAGAKILDLGSGPLTVPLGLWVTRQDLREKNLNFVCADTAPRPMELGRDIYRLLAGGESLDKPAAGEKTAREAMPAQRAASNESSDSGTGADSKPEQAPRVKLPWQISLTRDPLEVAIRKNKGKVNLITAANVLNELPTPRQESLEQKLGAIFDSMHRILEPGGQILLIEPGTRLGGKLVEMMRRLALERGYGVQSPCTHQGACPFLAGREDGEDDDFESEYGFEEFPQRKDAAGSAGRQSGGRKAGQAAWQTTGRETGREDGRGAGLKAGQGKQAWQPRPSGWCHFSHDTEGAWPELLRLSAAADLPKERLNLSFVLLKKPINGVSGGKAKKSMKDEALQPDKDAGAVTVPGGDLPRPGEHLDARVVSDGIKVPGKGICRYVCTAAGLGLLRDAAELPSGAEVGVARPQNGGVDPKTGALELVLR